jgi:hypothetical protein
MRPRITPQELVITSDVLVTSHNRSGTEVEIGKNLDILHEYAALPLECSQRVSDVLVGVSGLSRKANNEGVRQLWGRQRQTVDNTKPAAIEFTFECEEGCPPCRPSMVHRFSTSHGLEVNRRRKLSVREVPVIDQSFRSEGDTVKCFQVLHAHAVGTEHERGPWACRRRAHLRTTRVPRRGKKAQATPTAACGR